MSDFQSDVPSIRFLNQTGDVTITWDEDNYDAVVAMVKEKMAAGYTFMIVRKVTQKGRRKILKDVADLSDAAGLAVSNVVNGTHLMDDDLARLFEAGKIVISRTPQAQPPLQLTPLNSTITASLREENSHLQSEIQILRAERDALRFAIQHGRPRRGTQTIDTTHRAKSAEEVVSAEAIAIRPIAGG